MNPILWDACIRPLLRVDGWMDGWMDGMDRMLSFFILIVPISELKSPHE
jgi:hypothetical protein